MKSVINIVFLIFASLTILCCKQAKYIPIQHIKSDTFFLIKNQKDTIYERDSISVKAKNDTVYIERFKYKYEGNRSSDTIYVNRVDSVNTPVPIERKLGKWEVFVNNVGTATIGGTFLLIGLIIVRYILRRFRL